MVLFGLAKFGNLGIHQQEKNCIFILWNNSQQSKWTISINIGKYKKYSTVWEKPVEIRYI